MKREYQRRPILNFSDLTPEQQEQVKNDIDSPEEETFILWHSPKPTTPPDILPLSMFMRLPPWRNLADRPQHHYHGIYGLSYFSAYAIILNKTAEEATLIYITT